MRQLNQNSTLNCDWRCNPSPYSGEGEWTLNRPCTEVGKTLAQPVGFWQAALGAFSLGAGTSQDQMTQMNKMGEVEGQQKAKYKDEMPYLHELKQRSKQGRFICCTPLLPSRELLWGGPLSCVHRRVQNATGHCTHSFSGRVNLQFRWA